MTSLPPARDGNPLKDPEHPYAIGPAPKRTRYDRTPSPYQQVHKVYGEDKNHWFVQCATGRLSKDAEVTKPLDADALTRRLPVDVEHCNGCFSTRERLSLRRAARQSMMSPAEPRSAPDAI